MSRRDKLVRRSVTRVLEEEDAVCRYCVDVRSGSCGQRHQDSDKKRRGEEILQKGVIIKKKKDWGCIMIVAKTPPGS